MVIKEYVDKFSKKIVEKEVIPHPKFLPYAPTKRASSSGSLPAARHSTGSESAGGRSGGKGSC